MEVSVTKNNHAQGYLHGMTKGDGPEHRRESSRRRSRSSRPWRMTIPDLLAGKPLHGVIPWPSAMPDLQPRMMAYYDKLSVLG